MSSSVVNFLSKSKNSETFNSSGTFNVPAGINLVWVVGYGGGGGGINSNPLTSPIFRGSLGAVQSCCPVAVTPGSSISVTIGSGGGGTSTAEGGRGLNTTFGSLVTFEGASGASRESGSISTTEDLIYSENDTNFERQPNGSMGHLKLGTTSNLRAPASNNGFIPTTPSSGTDYPNSLRGGTGPSAVGGAGVATGTAPNATANTGAGGGSSAAGTGGNGGSGRLIVFW